MIIREKDVGPMSFPVTHYLTTSVNRYRYFRVSEYNFQTFKDGTVSGNSENVKFTICTDL